MTTFSKSIGLYFIYLLTSFVCQSFYAKANGAIGSECSVQEDCTFPYSCLALGDDDYSLDRVVVPPIPCETSGKDKCMCSYPSTITEECDDFSNCDPSVSCRKTLDCTSNKFCFRFDPENNFLGPEPCSDSDSTCTCANSDKSKFGSCIRSSECENGERCAQLENLYAFKCVSCNLMPELSQTILTYTDSEEPPQCQAEEKPSPTSTPQVTSSASTEPTTTTTTTPEVESPSNGPASTPEPTESKAPVPESPVPESPVPESPAASSPGVAPSSTTDSAPSSTSTSPEATNSGNSDSSVCIDVVALKDFSSHELVFSEHRRASVLCDSFGSCATPGHMVTFNGVPMSMMSYCSTNTDARCVKTIKHVNSPRMKAGLRISSATKGLEFTSLAARYQTKTEEWILKKLLRLGA